MTKGSHVIHQYIHATNTILCVCGWVGNGDEPWIEHKKWGKSNPFSAPKIPSYYKQMTSKKYRKISFELLREAQVENA